MKFTFTLFALFISAFTLNAQDLTGIWRGNFYSGTGFYKQEYRYEVQIDEAASKALKGVTYSYRTTVFYGKAALQGIYMDKNKTLIIKETEMLEMKISDQSVPCLMTCYLDFYTMGKKQILEGNFTSINANSGQDCGSGNVYLEKVEESDFKKEDFLVNKKPVTPAQQKPVATNQKPAAQTVKATPSVEIKRLQTALGVTPDGFAGPKTTATLKTKLPSFNGKITPGNADSLANAIAKIKPAPPKKPVVTTTPKNNPPVAKSQPKVTPQKNPVNTKVDTVVKSSTTKPIVAPPAQQEITKKNIPVPEVIKQRENPLVKTIITNNPDIKVELYDNGEIDGDTITVYHNNEVIAMRKGLTADPVTINIKADPINTYHEFIMVANNLGSIPPNTALMVITTGGKRYELFISSDEKKNAKVVIEYKVPSKEGK